MGTLSDERRAKVAIGGLYVPAEGAALPLSGRLDDGSCRTWQFCAHGNPDGTVSMRDTYWRGLEADSHDRAYMLDDGSFEGLFPMFELAVADPAAWRRIPGAERDLYDGADLFLMRGGASGRDCWLLRPGAAPDPAYLVAEARMRCADALSRARRAASDAAAALADLERAVADAEAAGCDWDGSRVEAEAASSLEGAPRMTAGDAGAAGEYGVFSGGRVVYRTAVAADEEVARVPCGARGLAAFAVMADPARGHDAHVLVADGAGPACAAALTPGNLAAVRACRDARGAREAFGGADFRVSGNASAARVADEARSLLAALGMVADGAR